MAQVSIPQAEVFGRCDGVRPWLGPAMKEKCDEMNRLLVRTASNAYFPQRISVISLPERNEAVREAVTAAWDFLETAESEEDVARERRKPKVRTALENLSDAEVWAEIQTARGTVGAGEIGQGGRTGDPACHGGRNRRRPSRGCFLRAHASEGGMGPPVDERN